MMLKAELDGHIPAAVSDTDRVNPRLGGGMVNLISEDVRDALAARNTQLPKQHFILAGLRAPIRESKNLGSLVF